MAEFSITQPTGTDLRAYGTDTTALPNGNVVVVWEQTSSDANIEETIGIRVLGANGTAVSNEFFTQSATAAAPPDRFEDGPEVIAIDDTHFVVAWSSFNITNGVYEIHARTVTLSGATLSFGADKVISDTTKDGTGQLSLARMDNGNIAFAWGEFAADYLSSRAVVRIMDSSLNPLSPITQVSQNTAAGIGFVEIIANGNALSVAWKQNAGVGSIPTFAYQFTANANGTIPALTLGDITVRTGQTQLHDFVELANGNLLVLTIGGPIIGGPVDDGDRLFGTIYNSTLTSIVKPTFQINQNEQSTGVVYSEAFAFAGGGFGIVFDQEADSVVANDNNRDVFYRIYNNAYNAVGNQIALHAPNGADLRDLQPAGVVTSADGDVTFVWERKNGAAGNEVLVGQQITNLEPNPPAPTVDTNTGSSLNEGGLDVIAATELETNDPDTPDANLVYTVTTASVANGSLWVDTDGSGTINGGEAALGVGGTFTQANIAAGLLKYRHNGGETIADGFGFSVTDGTTPVTGQTFSFTVNAVDDPAVAVDDSFTTTEALVIGAGLNVFNANPTTADNDPDGPAFGVTEVNGVGAAVGTQIPLASGALLTLNANGTFSYDPNGAFNSLPGPASGASNLSTTDSFSYTITGGDTATVTVSVSGLDSNADNLIGTAGGDSFDGGVGTADRVDYSGAGAVVIDLATPANSAGGALGDSFVNVEVLLLSANADSFVASNAQTFRVRGGGGIDTLTGAGLSDLFYGESGGDILSGNAGNDFLYGGGDADALAGGAGLDYLDGGAGGDTLTGGADNDTYIVDDVADSVVEAGGGGNDRLYTTVSLTGANAMDAEIEYGALLGGAALDLEGNASDNTLVGNAGVNQLFGGGGNDKLQGLGGDDAMTGGEGNDTYYVADSGDTTVEGSGALDGSLDVVYATASLASLGLNIEYAYLTGGADLNLTGNVQNNRLLGNGGANIIAGGAGGDRIVGAGGADTLLGEAGNDRLIGGLGKDSLGGGAFNDLFIFELTADSSAAVGLEDVIADFAAGDRIDLGAIDANSLGGGNDAFTFLGTGAFNAADPVGQLRYAAAGPDTRIEADVNGDFAADFAILVTGAHAFAAGDFVL